MTNLVSHGLFAMGLLFTSGVVALLMAAKECK